MRFTPTPLDGAWIVSLDPHADERGHFARTFCEREFAARRLNTHWPQSSLSHNARRGTLRGLHWQTAPHEETKLIRCTRGAVLDVIVDLRASSPTFRRWFSLELTADNGTQLYVPAGFAHGFQTLEDHSELHYQISEFYQPGLARGIRWKDPTLGIAWPIADPILSPRDAALPLLADAEL